MLYRLTKFTPNFLCFVLSQFFLALFHDIVEIANVLTMLIHFRIFLVFRTNFTDDIELYKNPNLTTQTRSKRNL